jgi:thiamine pyrophosphokinase
MGIVHTLHKKLAVDLLPSVDLFLLLDHDVCWLLTPGRHVISVPAWLRGDVCALIPFSRPARGVTTTGLKWNLREHKNMFF